MKINERNYYRIEDLYFFCRIYTSHRDFDLSNKIAKHKPLNWKQAEGLSDFCNQIIATKQSKPQDFISEENESSNDAINKYLILKDCLAQVKGRIGATRKNELYKLVKLFYRKKMYCYEMDSFFTFLISGLYMYANQFISYSDFLDNYCFEVSLFNGKKSPVKIKKSVKIAQYILNLPPNLNPPTCNFHRQIPVTTRHIE